MADVAGTAAKKTLVETKAVAVLFGLTVRRIQQLTQDGVLATETVGRKRGYDLMPTVRRYISYLQEKLSQKGACKEDTDNESRKIKAEAEIKEAKAAMLALERDELQGQMHRSEDVEAMTTELVFTIRGMLLALPGRLAIDLASISTPSEVSERIKQEVYVILHELANYKYDAAAYKKRVRDRQGWQDFEKVETDGDE